MKVHVWTGGSYDYLDLEAENLQDAAELITVMNGKLAQDRPGLLSLVADLIVKPKVTLRVRLSADTVRQASQVDRDAQDAA